MEKRTTERNWAPQKKAVHLDLSKDPVFMEDENLRLFVHRLRRNEKLEGELSSLARIWYVQWKETGKINITTDRGAQELLKLNLLFAAEETKVTEKLPEHPRNAQFRKINRGERK